MRSSIFTLAPLLVVLVPASAVAATLSVGPGKTYATPCAAIAAAQAGDVIEVDAAGSYAGDTCAWSTDALTVRGINGVAKIDLTGVAPSQKKGIFVIAAPNATVENFELSGAAISAADGNNGAGIRHQGLNLTVRGCFFHDNQNGILGGPLSNGQPADGQGSVVIERSEFLHNGAGDGFSHNMYIGHYGSFTLRGSWSHAASVGHLVKTRAAENYILYNRITDEDGTASYEIDVPNGGKTIILGNLVEQGPSTQNPNVVAYEEEGKSATNPLLELFVVNNSFVNDLSKGTFVHVGADVTTPTLVQNNIFVGPGAIVDQAAALQVANFSGDPKFVNQASFDWHLTAGSPCVDKGQAPGMGDGTSLDPVEEYLHPSGFEGRMVKGTIDVGAYELGGATGVGGAGGAGSSSSSSSGATGSSSSSGGTGGAGATSSGAGANGGAGLGANIGGGPSAAPASPGDTGGCGCRSAGEPSEGGVALLVGAAAWMARSRRRRARS